MTTEGMQSYPFPRESPATDTGEATAAPVADVPAGTAAVSGRAGDLKELEMGTSTKLDGRIRTTGDALSFDQTASDPRLAGTWTQSMVSDDLASSAEGRLFLYTGTALLENGEGYWLGSLTGHQAADEPFPGLQQTRLTGHGAYAGQSALLYHQGEGGFDTLEGLVFEGGFPSMPEPIEPPADQPRLSRRSRSTGHGSDGPLASVAMAATPQTKIAMHGDFRAGDGRPRENRRSGSLSYAARVCDKGS